MYLQFEQGKLCFKISYDGDGDASAVRSEYYSRLMELAKDRFPEIHRPARFRTGSYMTIAVVDEENVFGEGMLNIEQIIRKIK